LEEQDELVIRLIERAVLVARYRALQAQYPARAGGFRKMEMRHRAVAAALVVKVMRREAEAPRCCPLCRRS